MRNFHGIFKTFLSEGLEMSLISQNYPKIMMEFLVDISKNRKMLVKLENFDKIPYSTLGRAKFAQPGSAHETHSKVDYFRVLRFVSHNCITNIDFMNKTIFMQNS